MNKLLLSFFFLLNSSIAFSQTERLFSYTITPDKTGATCTFIDKGKAFSLHINGKVVKNAKMANPHTDANQHFINADDITIQLSIVPLPGSIPSSYNLNKLTFEQQKDILSGYIYYEMDYFKNELKVQYSDYKQMWVDNGIKPYLLWAFNQKPVNNAGNAVNGQIYGAMVCYNQVLVINIPLFKKAGDMDKAEKLINDIASTLRLYNK
ncbi:hypothetical protein BEL04_19835 [Mucilaginibacter sp. PPCGB 2223]|uniref:hypothetical protein n=1 Tax=Mucilaginibacter sp. PPCGB 2223 TaxID=1886027 RepID=UPI000826E8B5|nr:hypothetical protein [Mucilaginibacter sp. PPCGB 2223]OCX50972.1 hypothetical protein BEL04_19835 [Mucilaginibacter sp. PPCGB 2223]